MRPIRPAYAVRAGHCSLEGISQAREVHRLVDALLIVCTLAWMSLPTPVRAQSPPLTLNQAVEQALQNYPAVGVSQAQVDAAAAGIRLARTSYLPRVDGYGQLNRATKNNVAGLLFPQGLPTISGPASDETRNQLIWGSAVGLVASWEPFDFGSRGANVAAAEAAKARADAGVARTRLETASLAADSFLTLLAAQQTAKAAEAGVARSEAVLRVVESLVKADIRPGVELSRSRAEDSAARNQLIQARQAVAVAQALLARLIGIEPADVNIAPGPLLALPPAQTNVSSIVARNPAVVEQDAALQEHKARLKSVERAYYPRFNLLGSYYARGTGARVAGNTPGGALLGGSEGLYPDLANWAFGLTASFPLMDFASIRARQASEAALVQSETSRYQLIMADLTGRLNAALASADAARQVADNTPIQLEAAQATNQQALARYRAGLSTIVEVSDAQRLLTQAEIDDALARLGVWRAQLAVASAQGDLQSFLRSASR
jgi:outer membrane protein